MGSKSPSLRFGPAFLSSIHLKHHRWSINGPLRGSLQRNPHCHTVFYVFYSSNKKLASLSNIKMGTRSSMSFFKIPRRIRSATRTWLVSHWNRHNPNQPEQIAAQSEASEASEAAVPEASCSESYSLVEWLFHGDFLPESPRFSGLMWHKLMQHRRSKTHQRVNGKIILWGFLTDLTMNLP